jgi:hypothetical protein
MNVFYKKPVITEDKRVIIEQVYELGEEKLPNGILRKELKVIMEMYPTVELLLETIAKASQNYNNVALQGHKSVLQLELEKKALVDLQVMLSDMLGK